MVFNGVFERFPNARFGFLEGGIGWFVMCLERFDRSHSTHMEYQLRDDDMLGPKIGDSVHEYIRRQIDNDRLFIGCEGEEPAIAFAVSQVGNKPFFFSTDFPHEVTTETCRHELQSSWTTRSSRTRTRRPSSTRTPAASTAWVTRRAAAGRRTTYEV